MSSSTAHFTLPLIRRLLRGFYRIDYDTFSAVLQKAGLREDYCFREWPTFQHNPLQWATTFEPHAIAAELIDLANERGGGLQIAEYVEPGVYIANVNPPEGDQLELKVRNGK
jgi:hypothetical protein